MKKKRTVLALILFLSVLVVLFVGCSSGIKASLADQIQPGQTRDEIISILGKEGVLVGSGLVYEQWELSNGNYLNVRFIESDDGTIIVHTILILDPDQKLIETRTLPEN